MTYYAHLNENNEILGWYSDELHDSIPSPNIPFDTKTYQAAINSNANYYDGVNFIHVPETYELSKEEVKDNRRGQYASFNGSDIIFAEANRMKLMNEEGWEEKLEEAIARYNEIKLEHPFPEELE